MAETIITIVFDCQEKFSFYSDFGTREKTSKFAKCKRYKKWRNKVVYCFFKTDSFQSEIPINAP